MSKIISVINHKGGVGKTTTTANVAGALLTLGKKVLVVDLDGQANLTMSLGLRFDLNNTIYNAMRSNQPLPVYKNNQGINIVPSCLDLSAVETELINEPGRELILRNLLEPLKKEYDYIIIDCPPSLSLLSINALTASDSIIIPVQAQYLAMKGMDKLLNIIQKVKQRLNPILSIGGIVITMYDGRTNLNKGVSELVKDAFNGKVYNTFIRMNIALAEAQANGTDIYNYDPKCNGAVDYMNLTQEILEQSSK
jgi:chromosome partitioning protein